MHCVRFCAEFLWLVSLRNHHRISILLDTVHIEVAYCVVIGCPSAAELLQDGLSPILSW